MNHVGGDGVVVVKTQILGCSKVSRLGKGVLLPTELSEFLGLACSGRARSGFCKLTSGEGAEGTG